MSEAPTTDGQSVNFIDEHVILLAPTLGWWKGHYQLGRNSYEVKVGGEVADKEKLTTPRAKLLESSGERNKEWLKRFQKLDSKRAALVNAYSVTFPIHGVRIIPQRVGGEFLQKLMGPADHAGVPTYDYSQSEDNQSIAYQLAAAADSFCANYDLVMHDIQQHTDAEVYRSVERKLPSSASAMRTKFYTDVTPVELAGSRGNRVTAGDLNAYSSQIQAATRRRVDEALENMIREPREQLAKSLEDLHELISRDGRVTDASFNGVRIAVEKIKRFSFVSTPEMLASIQQLEGRLEGALPSQLTSTVANQNGLLTAIADVRTSVVDAEQVAADINRCGRRRRYMDLSGD